MKKLLLAILLVSQLAIYGQQKIYTDRTELEGVELPSAGQTRLLVVDENKKIKSEPKPDLSNFVESNELSEVAFSGSYNDLEDKPTTPEQFNPIAGSNISITGTYPNMTFSASGTVGTNWEDIGGDQSTVNLSGFTNDSGFITEVTESDVTQYETALTITESQISDLGDYLESGDNISELVNDAGYTTNTGTVTSVGLSLPTGLSVTNSPVTTSGTIGITYATGYQGYTTTEASKLSGIEAGAEVNVNADWNATSGDAQILNKPTLGTMAEANISDYTPTSGLSDVALSNDYTDLDNLPTIPAQVNITGGAGISVTGSYPNRIITNTSPNIVQDLNNTLSVSNVATTDAIFGATDTMTILGDGSGVSFSEGGRTLNVLKPDNIDSNYSQKFQNKNGDIAVTTDIPDYVDSYVANALTPYATQTYVQNYVAPVTFLDMDSDINNAINSNRLPNTTFVFKDDSLEGDLNKIFKIIYPNSLQEGMRFHLINADDKRTVTIEKWTGSEPDFVNLSTATETASISIPLLTGVEIFCDGETWYYSVK